MSTNTIRMQERFIMDIDLPRGHNELIERIRGYDPNGHIIDKMHRNDSIVYRIQSTDSVASKQVEACIYQYASEQQLSCLFVDDINLST